MAFADKKAAFAYVNEYQKEKYDRITVMATKGKKEEYKAAAKDAGMSLSAFVEMCVNKNIEKKPIKYGGTRQGLDNDGNSISKQEDCYECPNCGSFLGYVSDCKDEHYQDNYCRCCGQALDWIGKE